MSFQLFCCNIYTCTTGLLYYGDHFTSLSSDQLTDVLCCLLQQTSHKQYLYSSHSFRIGTATIAVATGIPVWFVKSLDGWSSDAHITYIQCPPEPFT